MPRTIQLNDIFVLICNNSSKEEAWDPADVRDNSVTLHGDNFFDLADNSYHIDQEVNTVDEVRQITASKLNCGNHKVPAQFNEWEFDVAYRDYFMTT